MAMAVQAATAEDNLAKAADQLFREVQVFFHTDNRVHSLYLHLNKLWIARFS